MTPEVARTTHGVTPLNVHTDDGFCVLVGILFSNTSTSMSKQTTCRVEVDPVTSMWEIELVDTNSRANMDCYARCILY